MTFDVLISGGLVVDGTGSPMRQADVAVRADIIAAVGHLKGAAAKREIDATGKVVTPGFIDAHAHSDVSLYLNPIAESQVAQGITTEIMGNCGYSPFPLVVHNRGLLLDPPTVPLEWHTAEQYFRRMSEGGMGINAFPQVGHVTVRAAVLHGEDRPATHEEIERMKQYVREAMEAGARGLSTGLDYHPSTTSDIEEIVELAKVVAEYDGIYTSHIRGYSHNVINAVAEALQVGRRAGVRVQISHIGVFGRKHWGWAQRILDILEQARRDGIRVACDMMAYPTAGAWWGPRAILPSWAYDWKKPWLENLPELRAKLVDPAVRGRLRAEIEARRERPKFGFHEEFLIFSDWRDVFIEELPAGSPRAYLLGMDMVTAAAQEGKDPCDLWFDLVLEEGDELATVHTAIGPEDFRAFLTDPWTMFGTDAIATAISRLHEPWNAIQPHPRHYGTFPRVLAKFVRDEGVLDLASAVRRMTGLVADHFGLTRLGYIREGYKADLVVLDLAQLQERGTWRLPAAYPCGIEHVFVSGMEVVSKGAFTKRLGGRMLTLGSG
ncbi:MAG: D-aminoacylase [Armatimonadota bacterium]|nr:D-aminoacylase [Armatimonadota bacterium]